jgi:glutamate dehydrogenase
VGEALPAVLAGAERAVFEARVQDLVDEGVAPELARRVVGWGDLFAALDIVGVARATDRPIPEVAEMYFLIGGRLDIRWLRDRIAALPRENRWQAMARAALRDDLFTLHADITADVLRRPDTSGDAEARLDAWLAAQGTAAEHCLGILADIHAGGVHDLTTLPVALREMRALLDARGVPAPVPVAR